MSSRHPHKMPVHSFQKTFHRQQLLARPSQAAKHSVHNSDGFAHPTLRRRIQASGIRDTTHTHNMEWNNKYNHPAHD